MSKAGIDHCPQKGHCLLYWAVTWACRSTLTAIMAVTRTLMASACPCSAARCRTERPILSLTVTSAEALMSCVMTCAPCCS